MNNVTDKAQLATPPSRKRFQLALLTLVVLTIAASVLLWVGVQSMQAARERSFERERAKERTARAVLQMLALALERYYADFRRYPPVVKGETASEALYRALCVPVTHGNRKYRPILDATCVKVNSKGIPELRSPHGGELRYEIINQRGWRLIDPGRDQLFGDNAGTDANGDGVPDGQDDVLVESPPK